MSDSLEGMPEFSKPAEEIVPLVVPDTSKPKCEATTKAGNPCTVPPMHGEKYCLGHAKSLAPELRAKWRSLSIGVPKRLPASRRKVGHYSKEELLAYLSERLDLVKERFGQMCNPEVEETICNIVRTMAVVYRLDTPDADEKAVGWRAKGAV